jgi:hypothetical protein
VSKLSFLNVRCQFRVVLKHVKKLKDEYTKLTFSKVKGIIVKVMKDEKLVSEVFSQIIKTERYS